MIDVLALADVRPESQDLPDLKALVRQLIGQPFLFFRVSYGDELRLHMGEPRPYDNPLMKNMTKGSYVLGARASSWVVVSGPKKTLLASDDPPAQGMNVVADQDPSGQRPIVRRAEISDIETGGYVEGGAIVSRTHVYGTSNGFGLALRFTDGTNLAIFPPDVRAEADDTPDEDPEARRAEIADWELMTPYSRVLMTGPGHRWAYLDSKARRNP